MKVKFLKTLIKIFFISAAGIIVFSIAWPLFQKKANESDIQHTVYIPSSNKTPGKNDYNGNAISSERILCVDDNTEALLWRLKIINSARDTLDFATFSFTDDRSARNIMAALYNAGQRGVKVRIIVDGLSAFLYLNRSDYFNTLAQNNNIEIKIYNPINFLKPWRMNYRMHDKYIIADNNIYILGGRNTKNLSLGDYEEKQDIDRDVVVFNTSPREEDSLHQVKNYFDNIWTASYSKDYYSRKIKKPQKQLENLQAYYKNMEEDFPSAFNHTDWYGETYPVNGIQLLHNPINNGNKVPVLWASLNRIMEQGQDILIQTPYIMFNNQMHKDLRRLNNDKRKISIITNSVENGANMFGCADYLNHRKRIRKTFSKVYEYNGNHSSHAKTILIDDNISIIGSFNYDMRSAYIDTELMLVIDSPELNSYLRGLNDINISQSRCVYPDGNVIYGDNYKDKKLTAGKKALYGFLRVVTGPVRYLL